ncbi:thiamine-phosphate pyrophosphorylase [Palleronia aestuarii]|uniref:Thiamine-phosphate pyrophosphorylase n=1 Tax=Palleronia aestuarii TaxID=568105 RepID=A0A2W7P387_9RHOB|nr:thiamine phosphate synthase [Palleronia aestuarii]PZX19886.1 thiamine-phosphate pyrophosphorylase [Palleronia aestuarii]
MPDDLPQIYLVTPPQLDPADFPDLLARILDAQAVACVRLDLATRDEDRLLRACDAVRAVTEPRDVALVLSDHVQIASRAGLDGVHLRDGARNVRAARKTLGTDAIVGAFCGTSRHDGMNAGETGADYVAFGPVGGVPAGDGSLADLDLFAWWSEMIELPCVAEGSLDTDAISNLSAITDFIALGEEIWMADDPSRRLAELVAAF